MTDARSLPALSESRRLRFFSLTAFYFAQGVPIGLLHVAVPAWLVERGYSAAQVGAYVAAVGLPWAFKLVAGPFMDRFQFPAMGLRRPWVIGAQFALVLSLALLALVPADGDGLLTGLMIIGVVANTFAAAQDVAVDGLAINVLQHGEEGRANALMMFGQVVGAGVFGGLSGVLLARFDLATAASVAAGAVAAVLSVALIARERPGEKLLPWSPGVAAPRGVPAAMSVVSMFGDLLRAFVLPMSLLLVAATLICRAGTGMALVVYPVFAVDELGRDAETYSQFISVIYMVAAVAGLGVGPLVDRFTARRVIVTACLGLATVLSAFALTPALWHDEPYVVGMLLLAELCAQAFTIAVIAQHMNITWIKVAATQFAVYMALANLGRSGGAALVSALSDLIDTQQAFLLMAGLVLVAGLMVMPFSESRHQARLRQFGGPARAALDDADEPRQDTGGA